MSELATVFSILALATGFVVVVLWVADIPRRRSREAELQTLVDRQGETFTEFMEVVTERRALVDQIVRASAPSRSTVASQFSYRPSRRLDWSDDYGVVSRAAGRSMAGRRTVQGHRHHVPVPAGLHVDPRWLDEPVAWSS